MDKPRATWKQTKRHYRHVWKVIWFDYRRTVRQPMRDHALGWVVGLIAGSGVALLTLKGPGDVDVWDAIGALLAGLGALAAVHFVLACVYSPIDATVRSMARHRRVGSELDGLRAESASIVAVIRSLRATHSPWLNDRTISMLDLVVRVGQGAVEWTTSDALQNLIIQTRPDGTWIVERCIANDWARAHNAAREFLEAMNERGFMETKKELPTLFGQPIPTAKETHYKWNKGGILFYEHVMSLGLPGPQPHD